MDYEKAYKEALERAKSKIENDKGHVLYEDDIKEIFPELVESEREQIRKNLISFFKKEYGTNSNAYFAGIEVKDIIAWLEKQGEQNPAEWSEEDEKNLTKCLETLIAQTESVDLETINKEWKPAINWLKSLKYRIKGE